MKSGKYVTALSRKDVTEPGPKAGLTGQQRRACLRNVEVIQAVGPEKDSGRILDAPGFRFR